MSHSPLLPVLGALLMLLTPPVSAQREETPIKDYKRGAWRPQDIPAGWTVKIVGKYELQSSIEADKLAKIGAHLNAMHELYSKTFPTRRTPGKPFTVKVFANRKDYLAYGAPPSSAAYYSKRDKEMVGYDTGKTDGVMDTGTTGPRNPIRDRLRERYTLDTLAVFAHEGWHQYFHWMCPSEVPFPSWCDEGIGEYFGTARKVDGKMTVGAVNEYRLGTIRAAIKRDKHIPLKDLVTFDQAKYYEVADLAYAQGWSFVHYLLEHPEIKKQRLLQKFMNTFVDQHEIEKAVQSTFAKVDWAKMEAEWKAWVSAMKYVEVDPTEAAENEAAGDAKPDPKPGKDDPAPPPRGGGNERP